MAAAAALSVPGPLARSRLRKVTGPGALPTTAARICATATAALPPPLSANPTVTARPRARATALHTPGRAPAQGVRGRGRRGCHRVRAGVCAWGGVCPAATPPLHVQLPPGGASVAAVHAG